MVETSFLSKVQEQKFNEGDTLRKPIVHHCPVEGRLGRPLEYNKQQAVCSKPTTYLVRPKMGWT